VVKAHRVKHEEQIEKQNKRMKELEKENRMLIQNVEQNSIE
jgi:cell division protein FtsB